MLQNVKQITFRVFQFSIFQTKTINPHQIIKKLNNTNYNTNMTRITKKKCYKLKKYVCNSTLCLRALKKVLQIEKRTKSIW